MHTLYRLAASLWAAIGVFLPFALWAVLPALAGAPEAGYVALLVAALFFAPAAFSNKWSEIGD